MHDQNRDIADLLDNLDRLQQENNLMRGRLSSKRYKAIDKVVDSVYKVMRLGRGQVSQSLIEKPKNKIRNVKKTYQQAKRRVNKGQIDIINVNFYDWDGKVLYKGGAERYVYDLACLLKKMGYRPRLLQGANQAFEKKYRGIPVIGVKSDSCELHQLSKIYKQYCRKAELIIASPLELAMELSDLPVISINHGINFDSPHNTFVSTANQSYSDYARALSCSEVCVCVDTNFINWVRTRDYQKSMKLEYIPNYYDEVAFQPVVKSKSKSKSKRIIFTYPRRIYAARGSDITIEAFDRVLEKYADRVELRLVGQINDEPSRQQVEYLMNKYPDNVSRTEYAMKDMPKAYQDTDVVLIPTRYSEGTSLSCIEGMASGSAVIATNVGGLPNLIIDGYNGLLISPKASELEEAVVRLVENPQLIKLFQKNGIEVAQKAFTKTSWDQKWTRIIQNALVNNNNK